MTEILVMIGLILCVVLTVIIYKKKKRTLIIPIILIIFTIIISFIVNKEANQILVDEQINMNDYNVIIQLDGLHFSKDSYKLIEEDSSKFKEIFNNNQIENTTNQVVMDNDCIFFELKHYDDFFRKVMLIIDPVTGENWCYYFDDSHYVYSVDLSDNDIEFIRSLKRKYTLVASQVSKSKGDVLLVSEKKEVDSTIREYEIKYNIENISEVYTYVSYKDFGSSIYVINRDDYIDGIIRVQLYDKDYEVKSSKLVIRGYEIINGENILYQNIIRLDEID